MRSNRSRKILRSALFVSATIAASACTQTHVTQTAVDFNKSMSEFTQKEILLNAVRASKRRPMQFSAITGGSGNLSRRIGVNSSFSFVDGVNVPFAFTGMNLSPNAQATSTHLAQISNLNSSEFFGKLMEPAPSSLYTFFREAGWSWELRDLMFFSHISFGRRTYAQIISAYETACRNAVSTDRDLCRVISNDFAQIEELWRQANASDDVVRQRICSRKLPYKILRRKKFNKNRPVITFPNRGREECDFKGFRAHLRILRLLDMETSTGDEFVKTKPIESKETTIHADLDGVGDDIYTKKGTKIKVKKEITVRKPLVITFRHPKAQSVRLESALSADEDNSLVIRSPQSMIYYLGDLIAAQHPPAGKSAFIPKVVTGIAYKPANLFHVRKGAIGNAAVTVLDDENERYGIPRPNYGADDEDRSLQVLALINQVIAIQTRREDIPSTSTISLVQ